MFQGAPGLSVDWPEVIYPAPLSQYESLSPPRPTEPPKPLESPKEADKTGKASGVRGALVLTDFSTYKGFFRIYYKVFTFVSFKKKKRKSKGKKTKHEESKVDDREEEDKEAVPEVCGGGGDVSRNDVESLAKTPTSFLYPFWKLNSSESEFSDIEGNTQSKLRYTESFLHI